MFDEEIANDKKNMKFLEDVAKLAAECLKMEDKMRPEMVEVADRLRTIRKDYHHRIGRNSTCKIFVVISDWHVNFNSSSALELMLRHRAKYYN